MAISATNPCPRCNHIPDVHVDLQISRFESQSIACFCNFCGTKLAIHLTVSGKAKVNSACLVAHHFPWALPATPYVRMGELLPEDFHIALWRERRKRVFVCHSHDDDPWCNAFAESLKRQDLDIFYDSDPHSIRSGANWIKEIGQAIDQCHYFVIVLTPNAWLSEWVQQELNVAFAARREIVPLLLKATRVQGLLRSVQWTDVRESTPADAAVLVAELFQQ